MHSPDLHSWTVSGSYGSTYDVPGAMGVASHLSQISCACFDYDIMFIHDYIRNSNSFDVYNVYDTTRLIHSLGPPLEFSFLSFLRRLNDLDYADFNTLEIMTPHLIRPLPVGVVSSISAEAAVITGVQVERHLQYVTIKQREDVLLFLRRLASRAIHLSPQLKTALCDETQLVKDVYTRWIEEGVHRAMRGLELL